ncbi:hypothetical protein CHELA1G11_12809 [Hyphomicrobiales bacterium]|nr:hypothetical protein CHELA1G2_11499 [Hyphomicrobiales bacterium]CAH1667273.1 hypothetical protein CHELA1G11_12809 [Hyphomicrobiales bacterium]
MPGLPRAEGHSQRSLAPDRTALARVIFPFVKYYNMF